MRFGETTREFTERGGGEEGTTWIKGFKEGSTRIRFVQPYDDWVTYREHYDQAVNYFPCCEDNTCVGCRSEVPRTRERSRRVAFNALDDEGNLRVYKVGIQFARRLQAREQRLGSLTDRDYTIIRTGTDKNSTFEAEPGEVYELDVPVAESELESIAELNRARYMEILPTMSGEDPWTEPEAETEAAAPASTGPISRGGAKKAAAPAAKTAAATTATKTATGRISRKGTEPAAEAPAAKKAPAKKAAAKTAAPEPEAPLEGSPNGGSSFDSMELPELREWLTTNNVEFPPRAPRSRLILIAQEADQPPY